MRNPFEEAPGQRKSEQVSVKCPECNGSGTAKKDGKDTRCTKCSGTGKISVS
jgi:DnaJ-class molecular chaperone